MIERLSRAWAALVSRREALPVPRPTTSNFLVSLGLNNQDVAPIVTKKDQLDSYVGWVYGCCSKIAQDLRANPRDIWIQRGDDDEKWPKLPEAQWPAVLIKPNLHQTWGQFMELRNLHKDLTGEAWWHLITNKNLDASFNPIAPPDPILGIELIQPDYVQGPVYNDAGTDVVAWTVLVEGHSQKTIDARNLVLDFYPNPRDTLRGASPVEAFAISHHLDIYMRAYGLKLIRDGAMIGQYVTSEEIETLEQADAAEARLMRRYRSAGRIPVFGKGAELKTATLPLRDLDMLRMLKPSQDQILGIYGVPKSKFGIMDGEGYANAATGWATYQKNCLLPRLRTFDEVVNLLMPRLIGKGAQALYYESKNPVELDREFILKKATENLHQKTKNRKGNSLFVRLALTRNWSKFLQ